MTSHWRLRSDRHDFHAVDSAHKSTHLRRAGRACLVDQTTRARWRIERIERWRHAFGNDVSVAFERWAAHEWSSIEWLRTSWHDVTTPRLFINTAFAAVTPEDACNGSLVCSCDSCVKTRRQVIVVVKRFFFRVIRVAITTVWRGREAEGWLDDVIKRIVVFFVSWRRVLATHVFHEDFWWILLVVKPWKPRDKRQVVSRVFLVTLPRASVVDFTSKTRPKLRWNTRGLKDVFSTSLHPV